MVSAKKPSYFSAQDCVKVSPGFAAVEQLIVYPIVDIFLFFIQLFEVIWETTANPGETLTPSCAEKSEGGFALYCMKFDLVLRKL